MVKRTIIMLWVVSLLFPGSLLAMEKPHSPKSLSGNVSQTDIDTKPMGDYMKGNLNDKQTQTGHFITANGLEIYYEEYGNGSPLILLHGGTVSSASWYPHIAAFSEHFKVIAPDSRGHGRTNNPEGKLSYRLMADDVAAFIKALGLNKPMVCGYSDGGQIAFELGIRYPNLTGAIVLGATSYTLSSETYHESLKALGIMGPGVVDIMVTQESAPELLLYWKTAHFRPDNPDYWKTLLRQISEMFWAPLNYSIQDFKSIAVPALILIGDRDGMVPLDETIEMFRLIPNAELAVLPNATHMSAFSAVETFTGVVNDFLLRHEAPSGTN